MAAWTPLRRALKDVRSKVTYTWTALDDLVGGLPPSAYKHSAFWKGARSSWPGFTTVDVLVGHSVTFVRIGDRHSAAPTAISPPRPATPTKRDTPELPGSDHRADIVLVGCVKKKLNIPAEAKDLYVSPLFRKERAYAEQLGVPWFILSAQHGLVAPEEILHPYDLQLSGTSSDYRRDWGRQVVADLIREVGDLQGQTVEIHAGSAYSDAIRDQLVATGAAVVEPLAGLPLGSRLAWYAKDVPTARLAPKGDDIPTLIRKLTEPDHFMSPADFLASGGKGFRSPGLYSWWVDDAGAAQLSAGLGQPLSAGLIYAGLAGATRSGGQRSNNTLWGRIRSMHLGRSHEFSTFRWSLGSILAAAVDASEIDEDALTRWMHAHLRLIAVPVADADTLGALETEVLTALDPPLNLDQVTSTPLRQRLSQLRKRFGGKNS